MESAENYLEKIPMWSKDKHSLGDIRRFLSVLGHPDRKIKAIHVAGTNGKGSVCAYLTSVLMEAGYCVGTFISPHLCQVRERFLINGKMAEEEAFEAAYQKVLEVAESMKQQGLSHPSFFEFLFYMAMVLFEREQVDIMVIETGLGGRLDATNVLEQPLAAVITSISLDHTKYLGDTIPLIAGEKAGIIKKGSPVIFDAGKPEAAAVMEKRARELETECFPVGKETFEAEETKEGSIEIQIKAEGYPFKTFRIPFEAPYQAANAMVALKALLVLREKGALHFTDEELLSGFAHTKWAGRMEQVKDGLYLDGAHNPDGIEAFIRSVSSICRRKEKKAFLLFSAVADKDYHQMAKELCRELSWQAIGVVPINSERGLAVSRLAEEFKALAGCPVYTYASAKEGLLDMEKRRGGELLFCAGSLYLVGELKAALVAPKKGEMIHD